jgi:hypothetical protein
MSKPAPRDSQRDFIASPKVPNTNPSRPPNSPDTLAQQYLDALDGKGPHLNNLNALTAVGAQDVIVQIPEPVEAFVTVMALIALSLVARARAQRRSSR